MLYTSRLRLMWPRRVDGRDGWPRVSEQHPGVRSIYLTYTRSKTEQRTNPHRRRLAAIALLHTSFPPLPRLKSPAHHHTVRSPSVTPKHVQCRSPLLNLFPALKYAYDVCARAIMCIVCTRDRINIVGRFRHRHRQPFFVIFSLTTLASFARFSPFWTCRNGSTRGFRQTLIYYWRAPEVQQMTSFIFFFYYYLFVSLITKEKKRSRKNKTLLIPIG